ncbi:MAG TPA: DUF1801 domain-containing protein [Anaerolineales bacterium]|jgi:hypothetical protein|nr:DUF1801 domain-containing protein [Anaerolineales bacterium]
MDASKLIDNRIADTKDWRGKQMARLRKLIHEADPKITEEWKWDSPVFSDAGMVVSIGAFKDHVKANFFKGASIKDPKKLFNAGLEAKTTRSIDIHEGEKLDEKAFKDLVKAAVAFNADKGK